MHAVQRNNLGICIIIMYVDDMLIIGKKEQIQEFATKIQKEFSVKIQHNLADYLGCEFHMNIEKTKGWLGQPSIIKSLEQKFGERAMKGILSLTPGTPRFTARRLENQEDKVNTEDHETYRSGVGTLILDQAQQTRHLQSSKRTIKNYGCTSSSTFERNVQTHQVCTVYKRFWIKIQTDQEHKKMGTKSTK